MQCSVALLGTRTPYQEVFYWASGHQERFSTGHQDLRRLSTGSWASGGSHWELGIRRHSTGHKASGGSTGLGHQEALLLGTRTSGGSTGLGYQEALLLGTRISVVLCSMVYCFT